MKLWLMRHGLAGPAPSDEERRLTEGGAEGVRRVAGRLRAVGLDSPVVVSSPLVRAMETARLAAGVAGSAEVLASDSLKPGAGVARHLDLLRKLPPGRYVLLVGHQPDMGVLASFISGGPPLRLVPGAAAGMSVREEDGSFRGEIECVVSPEDPV